MKTIQWDPSFETGHKEIDSHHMTLVRTINTLIVAAESSSSELKALVLSSLDTFVEYTVLHFENEESLMKQMGYSEKDLHTQQHNSFKTKVVNFYKKHQAGENILEELVQFLTSWLIEHIQQSDKKLTVFIKNK